MLIINKFILQNIPKHFLYFKKLIYEKLIEGKF